MPFDGLMLAAVVHELRSSLPARVNKVYQPSETELVLHLFTTAPGQTGGERRRLLISAHPQWARLHWTWSERENPSVPPPFCMLLRKHLEGSRLVRVEQPGWERIARLTFTGVDELGEPVERILIAETMGKHSNVILIEAGGRILDALRRVPGSVNEYRAVLPGRTYVDPPTQNKLDPLQPDLADALEQALLAPANPLAPTNPLLLWEAVQRHVAGYSPLLAKEAVTRAGQRPDAAPGALTRVEVAALAQALAAMAQAARAASGPAFAVTAPTRAFAPFSLRSLPARPDAVRTYESPSRMLDDWHTALATEDAFATRRSRIARLLQKELERLRKKQGLQAESVKSAEDAEQLRLFGELLTAHLHTVKPGAASCRVPNWYEDGAPEVEIPLNPHLSPADNAQRYFKQYAKAKSTCAQAAEQLAKTEAELSYLEQVDVSLQNATTIDDLAELEQELAAQGYESGHRVAAQRAKRKGAGRPGQTARVPTPLRFRTSDGWQVLVGKNNRQNDWLTLRVAQPDDYWLHTKDIAGSHVILRVPPGAGEPPSQSLLEAAMIAAYHSKGRQSAQVPVDVTLRRHVRKPPGAKPGMVIYDHHRTLYVTPQTELVNQRREENDPPAQSE